MHQFPTWTIEPTRILTRRELGPVLADLKRQANRSAHARRDLVIVRLREGSRCLCVLEAPRRLL